MLLLIVAGLSVALYVTNNTPENQNAAETSRVLGALGEAMLLPSDKQPTVAKVEDIEALKRSNAYFYKDIAQGDYLILYDDRAIIFRLSTKQIINVAPIAKQEASSSE